MTLVTVVNVLGDAHSLEGEHTTDTEEDLLLEAVLPVTTIELEGDGAVKLRVELVVGVEQVQGYATYLYLPYVSVHLIVDIGNCYYEGLAVLVHYTLQGEVGEV